MNVNFSWEDVICCREEFVVDISVSPSVGGGGGGGGGGGCSRYHFPFVPAE